MRDMLVKITDYMARHTSTLEQWHDEWEMKLTGKIPDWSHNAAANMEGSSLASALSDSSHKSILLTILHSDLTCTKAQYQAFFWVLIDLIVELLGLIINQG